MNATLHGLSLIAGKPGSPTATSFQATDPATGETLLPKYHEVSTGELAQACEAAREAFRVFRVVPPKERARLLRVIADRIETLGNVLLDRFVAETGLPRGRAEGERARTIGQLRLFATSLECGSWSAPEFDAADPSRQPAPKPETRLFYAGVGPVAVFGPANFPLAFSVAGGDTASALAAGCPVVCKAHSSHPGVSELVGRAISDAIADCGLPAGVFSLLFGSGRRIGTALVAHPAIAGVGFTGSKAAGRTLFDIAVSRPHPIPVFAEMSSINPVVIRGEKLDAQVDSLVEGCVSSLTLGVGQFCTNPGLIFLPEGASSPKFAEQLKARLASQAAGVMLNSGTLNAYGASIARVGETPGVETLLPGTVSSGPACLAGPALFRTSAASFRNTPDLQDEMFGPATVLVTYANDEDLLAALGALEGQLTATIHGTDQELAASSAIVAMLETVAGRIVFNGWPTGVEVCASMVHGGPWPASSDARFTSVGTTAIRRFLRPVCHQNSPASEALPLPN